MRWNYASNTRRRRGNIKHTLISLYIYIFFSLCFAVFDIHYHNISANFIFATVIWRSAGKKAWSIYLFFLLLISPFLFLIIQLFSPNSTYKMIFNVRESGNEIASKKGFFFLFSNKITTNGKEFSSFFFGLEGKKINIEYYFTTFFSIYSCW